jgi:chromosome segregation protein
LRLTQINLAGFKSFVDPARIPVPGQLVGIVGPNGCGKSNVIDAVRWVLGETSARHLRGETMQDVLFNGSGERKPVNRASVELIFDNSLGKAAGQWSAYAEISIKRVLQRDGDSAYYINNIHVRRRDIADIFLGTGLGSRAYAIIEQGMISRVIEARPEELRIFLEEAAGVSKYRERRRETELRLKDTRDNLLRVDDIRRELEQQIERLQGQAAVTAQYHGLQRELRMTQGLLWFTRKQESAASRSRYLKEIERLDIELEAETARLRDAEKRLEDTRSLHYQRSDEAHTAQGALYESNSEVARLEQQIAHVRDSKRRTEHQIAALRSQLTHGESQLAGALASLDEWRAERSRLQQTVEILVAASKTESEKLPLAEEAFRAASRRRDELQQHLAQTEQSLQVEQTKLVHARRLIEQMEQRRQRLTEEQGSLPVPDAGELERLRDLVQDLEEEIDQRRASLANSEALVPQLEQDMNRAKNAHDEVAQRLAGIEARLSVLQQLQDRLARGAELEDWLTARGLSHAPRLWQGIGVEPGWEDALEAVLRERLNGMPLDELEAAESWLNDPPPGKLTVVDLSTNEIEASDDGKPADAATLLSYVTCRDHRLRAALAEWLRGVYVTENASAAIALRGQLAPGSLLVTREGHVFTRCSVNFHAPDSELHGVLSRQREIEQLQEALAAMRLNLSELDATVSAAEQDIAQRRIELSTLREQMEGAQQRLHGLQIEALRLSEQAQRLTQRGEQIASELGELTLQIEAESALARMAESNVERLQGETAQGREQLELANDLYRRADAVLTRQREALRQAEQECQEAVFRLRTSDNKIKEIEGLIEAFSGNVMALKADVAAQEAELAGCDDAPWLAQLQRALEARSLCEQALAYARNALEGVEKQLKEIEQERLACEQKLQPLRERISEIRLKEQEARLTEEQFARQLSESGAIEEELRALIEKGTRSGALQAEITRLTEAISALGAVNLAALDELQTAQERRNYLDAQSRDLTEAMATLEDAIRRIDRETRERLQQTFDEVNRNFCELFPALFGGGNAKLVLTGEEILDCGMQVFAQPPGKKNTSIHLLSGGEKALTALALVFSMFQLNPAPFCLLDEVDAPLDDNNTERFCELVRKMSAKSQFLFISHNKITMEIANQLLGITMQEPGVSRVVAVDIEEAMKLTEKAAA